MTAVLASATSRSAPTASGPATYRFEMTKQLSQWRVRVMFAVCLLAPAVFVAIVSNRASMPSDTAFGRWMNASGWAGALVVLTFCCNWALPLLMSIVAGDVFAVEDRLGTWRHLLMVVRSPGRVFAAKAAASLTVAVCLLAALCASSVIGGVVSVGSAPLVGLDGHLIDAGDAARLVLIVWAYVGLGALAFGSLGLLGSVLFGRSPIGLLAPAVLAFVLQAVQLLPLPTVVRVALPSQSFMAWRGLFTDPVQLRPLILGLVISVLWIAVPAMLAFLAFRRRDFTDAQHDGSAVRTMRYAVVPLVALLAVGAGLSATGVANPLGSGISRTALQRSIATSFAHLYRLQTAELGRPDVTEQQLRTSATCEKAGSSDAEGPGNDWRCTVSWHIPGATAVGSAIYQLDVAPEGRYVADGDGPKEVNGYFQVPTPTGAAPNPLWQVDGLLDLTSTPPKG